VKFLACCFLPDKKLYGNCFYWCKYVRDFNCATQCFKSAGSGSKDLTPYTCLCYRCCALEQGTKRRAPKGVKKSARTCGPLLKLLLIKKIYHLNTLHLYPAKTRNPTKKELPNSYIKLLNYRHPIVIFLQKTRVRFLQKTVETCNHVCRVLWSSGKNIKETRWQFSWKNSQFSWWVQSIVYPQIMCFPWLFQSQTILPFHSFCFHDFSSPLRKILWSQHAVF